MRALVLSDIHGAQLDYKRIFEIANPEIVIIPGDLPSSVDMATLLISFMKKGNRTNYMKNFYERFSERANFKQIQSAKRILSELMDFDIPVILNHGNTETRETRSWMRLFAIRNHDLYYVGDSQVRLNNYQFIGHGWVEKDSRGERVASPGEIDYSLSKANLFDTIGRSAPLSKNAILVSHSPPYNTPIDFLPFNQIHAGSKSVREIMDSGYFQGIISGHLHECPGAIKSSVGWWGVNAGAAVEDRCCLIDLETVKISWIKNIIKRTSYETLIYQNRRNYNYDNQNRLQISKD